jgi:lipopolysaccharide transport system permease protein
LPVVSVTTPALDGMRHDRPLTVVEPTGGAILPRVKESWRDRELLYFLAARDVKVRYAQTVLGWFWAVLQPLGLMLVFLFAFRTLGDVKTDGVPYALFAFAGLAFWTFFSRGVTAAADSLVLNAPLLTKTAAARLLMPLAAIAAAMVDLLITMALLVVFIAAYGHPLSWRLAVLPAVVALSFVLASGLGVLLSAINVRYRDIRNALPFAIQLLLFVSPIGYSLSSLSDKALTILSINPLVGIIEAWRWCWLGTPAPSTWALCWGIGIPVVLIVVGLWYFSRVSRDFADVA